MWERIGSRSTKTESTRLVKQLPSIFRIGTVFGGVNNHIGDDSWCWRTKPKFFVKDFTKWKAKMDQCYLVVWNLDFREALRKINEQSEGERTLCHF